MNRRLVFVLGAVAAAHLGVLAYAASRWHPEPKQETQIANLLMGHVDPDQGDFVAEGMVRARIRAK